MDFIYCFLIFHFMLQTIEAVCNSEKGLFLFGDHCDFMCHCKKKEQCDVTTGECPSGCEWGWYGPGCQYSDILNTKETKANDKNSDTCYRQEMKNKYNTSKLSWSVRLPNNKTIHEIQILTTPESLDSFQKFKVFVEYIPLPGSNAVKRTKCFKNNKDAPKTTKFIVLCEKPVIGNSITIELNQSKQIPHLCDVRANGGRNLAFKRLASQLSMPDNCADPYCKANFSVDGINRQDFWYCSYTKGEDNPWWQVDIGFEMRIWRVLIFTHKSKKSMPYLIHISNDSGSWKGIQFISSATSADTQSIALDSIGRFIRIVKEGEKRRLHVCEVLIYGDCPENRCGYNCQKSCECTPATIWDKISGDCSNNCEQKKIGSLCNISDKENDDDEDHSVKCNDNCLGDVCDTKSGTCTKGCTPGWEGDYCNKTCVAGTFGVDCSKNCSSNCNNGTCHHVNGTCLDGCQAGYQNYDCEKNCTAGTFGKRCIENCSNHCIGGSEMCRNTDGHCVNGCAAGWMGKQCKSECVAGTFGSDCSKNCSSNCKNGTCHHVDGICLDGCQAGYQGHKCDKNCTAGTFGKRCTGNCSNHCIGGSEMCRNTDGHCVNGCAAGWMGKQCKSGCVVETFGVDCSNNCSSNCKNGTCHHVDGTCLDGCQAGYQDHKCDKKCSPGTFGDNCASSCSKHCVGGYKKCRNTDGQCLDGCQTGWNGTNCFSACDVGFYGENCANTCGHCKSTNTCNHVTGTCYGGCESGYGGDACLQTIQASDSLNAVTGGGVMACIIIVLVIFIVIVLYKRRRINKRNDRQGGNLELTGLNTAAISDDRMTSNNDNIHVQAGESSSKDMNIYNNSEVPEQTRNPIPLSNLLSYVKQCLANPSHFADEFMEIPYGMQKSSAVAKKSYNRGKNRYKDMHAYDHSRVVLKTLSEERGSDYVNASFIKGHHKENAYIAAQGPIVTSVDDFWRMIWEKDVYIIAMVTNLVEETKTKCLQYWPPVETKIRYGYILVSTESEINFADFTIRNFKVTFERENSHRDIRQFHFTAWPDKGVPLSTSSLIQFWRKVRRTDETKDHTWLVHCSAGVGRTGTFIATDILYDQGKDRGYIDVYQCVKDLRDQRVNMVQTKEQYVYLHTLMVEALVLSSEPVPLDNLHKTVRDLKTVDPTIKRTRLVLQYEALNEDRASFHTDVEIGEMFSAALLDENKNKNRFHTILPPNRFRAFLVTNIPGCTNYINAVHMPSYSHKPGFIITQKPLDNTVIDYCRLIYEQNVKVIVMFPDKDCVVADMTVGPFKWTQVSEEDKLFYIKRIFNFVYNTEERKIAQLEFKNWNGIQITPGDPTNMLCFLQEVEFLYRVDSDNPVLVQCFDGSEKSGLFVVLMNILEHARFDNEVSIPQVIRQLRNIRQQIIPNFEQFQFCYDAVLCFIDSNQMYANM